ncbi:MAG: GFA family protein [Sphingomonadaceae bacterium]
MTKVDIEGGCHCGAVRFEAELPQKVEILICNCSICAMTGFRHLIVPHEDFTLLSGEAALTSYRFGTRAAEHLFCATCGVKSFYQPRSHARAWSINANCVELPPGIAVAERAFDGRHWEEARAALD